MYANSDLHKIELLDTQLLYPQKHRKRSVVSDLKSRQTLFLLIRSELRKEGKES